MKIAIGTRFAKVSLVQAKSVAVLLTAAGAETRLEPIRTIGDSLDVGLAGQRGTDIFTKELNEALVKGEVDVAVHDMSHVAATLPAGVSIVAVPARLDAREAFVSNRAKKLAALPEGARVGASGVTRAPQLVRMGRGIEVVPVISDMEANLRAVNEGAVDAVVMAASDLIRMKAEKVILEYLPLDRFVPALGQGALAVEVKSERKDLMKLVSRACHNNASGLAIRAERAFLKSMPPEGAVFAANAEIKPAGLQIVGFISNPDGSEFVMDKESGKVDEAPDLGKRLAEKLLKKFT